MTLHAKLRRAQETTKIAETDLRNGRATMLSRAKALLDCVNSRFKTVKERVPWRVLSRMPTLPAQLAVPAERAARCLALQARDDALRLALEFARALELEFPSSHSTCGERAEDIAALLSHLPAMPSACFEVQDNSVPDVEMGEDADFIDEDDDAGELQPDPAGVAFDDGYSVDSDGEDATDGEPGSGHDLHETL